MKLKSLLLGSAAALIAVTGARAADAVVADPEPVEYVRVCDMYGAGFFYIPGTETCLKLSGYVRVEYTYTDYEDNDATTNDSAGSWVYRGRLNVDARNETDWGTLRSQLRFQGDGNGGADAPVGIDRALVSVGGLRFGYSDQFVTTHHGYGWQKAANDGYYDFDQAVMLDYTYAANGFSATVGIQDELGTTAGAENPDLYAGLAYAGSWGRVAGSVASDGITDDLAWKISANISVIENLGINGWYANDDGKTHFVTAYLDSGVESEWGVDVNYQVTDTVNLWVGYTAYEGTAVATGTSTARPVAIGDDLEGHRIGVGAIWNPIPGLSFRPEAVFGESEVANTTYDYSQFRLRVVRSW